MPYVVLVTATAEKMLKKLPPQVKREIVQAALQLQENPRLGDSLTGELRRFRSLHIKLNNVHYRIAYEINEPHQEVLIRAVAVRENFYRRLEKMKRKSTA
ncbi:MAG: type II toxin-antitoxin system RelE/ParE family toxin [Chloroflexota bacterium]